MADACMERNDYVTNRQAKQMRCIMCGAMGDGHNRRPEAVRLLAESRGKWDPELVRAKRMVKHWQNKYTEYTVPQEYWDTLQSTSGKQGPVSLMRHVLERYEIRCDAPDRWDIAGRTHQVSTTMDIARRVARQVSKVLWACQAKRRPHLRGMESGRDEQSMQKLIAEFRSPRDTAMLGIIQTDSVYTPATAFMRWGYTSNCRLCGSTQGDWMHYIRDCPHTEREPGGVGMPECIRYTGNIPSGWVTPAGSRQVRRDTCWGEGDTIAGGGEVATDGGSRGQRQQARARWSIHWGARDARNDWGPVPGEQQTAARAEAHAVARMLTSVDSAVILITDNKGVYNKLRKVQRGIHPVGAHQEEWGHIRRRIHRLQEVHWV